ncbi:MULTISPECIES: hypothetical protein [Nocardioides]|uniref:hypothetical protein n=1 Tax=Nocardioides TaxID=1839 RepID=UPI00033066C7|nr:MULTISPECIES: hypothetical protein [Nocardioides]EON25756.1 hypothetical protein CF8_0079 [Nocardioides sp. CF8]
MKKPAKTGLLTASLLLVGASVVGCGGGGAPTDASEKEFCDSLTSVFDDIDMSEQPSEKEALALIKAWAKDMEEVGTPENISDDARDGFELMIEQVGELKEDDSAADLEKLDESLSDSEKKATEAFEKYSTDTCGSMMDQDLPEVPTPSS